MNENVENAIWNVLEEVRILYRPSLKKISKSTNAAILLWEIIGRCKKSETGSFFKFKIHCNHPEYEKGESWCEELNFSIGEFDGALRNIGTNKNNSNKEKIKNALVWYYTDKSRRTWYEINTEKLKIALAKIYK